MPSLDGPRPGLDTWTAAWRPDSRASLEARFASFEARFETQMRAMQQNPVEMRIETLQKHAQLEKVRLDHVESMWLQLDARLSAQGFRENSEVPAHQQTETETSGDRAGVAEDPKDEEQKADAGVFERAEHHIDAHTLPESVWDAFFLQWFQIRLGAQGSLDVAMTAVLYTVNVVIQVAMTYLVFTNMSKQKWVEDDLLDDLLKWRLSLSQGVSHYHEASNTSLATRVCTGDDSRILAGDQADTRTQIAEYLLYNKPFNGPVLLGCALIIWLLLIGIEVMETLEFTSALFSIKHSNHNEGTWHQDEEFIIDSISSTSRGLFVLTIAIPRIMIAGWLGAAGVLYLLHSNTMGDLILNCMALGFILDMDELLYSYVPKRTASKLSVTRPIILQQFSPLKKCCGLDLGRYVSYCVLLLIMPAMLVIWSYHVEPLLDLLSKANAILCGGKANMVFTNDKSSSVMSYAITAPRTLPLAREYRLIAVMQAIELQNVPELSEFLKEWPQPDKAYASRTSLENLDTLYKQAEKEAVSQQLCLDLDYDEPSRAALKAFTGMDLCNETSGYDMHGRCTELVVRRYCPETCFCGAVSWWYHRRGCPPTCETTYKIDLKAFLYAHATENDGCKDAYGKALPNMAPVGGNLTQFAESVEIDLILDGKINQSGHVLGHWQSTLEMQSLGQCIWHDDAWVDREELLSDSDWRCKGIMLINSLFDLGLCDLNYARFRNGQGNIAAYCPDSCQVCPLKEYRLEGPRTIMDSIYKDDDSNALVKHYKNHDFNYLLKPFLACGYEWIFCGETRDGTTIGAKNYLGSYAADKIYRFHAEPGKFYEFKVSGASKKTGMKLKIYDSHLQFARINLLYAAETNVRNSFASFMLNFGRKGGATVKGATFSKAGTHYLVVETVDALVMTGFRVSMSTNESSCGRGIPLHIRCGEALNASTPSSGQGRQTEFDVTGLLNHPERIFRFQADAGVEYTFDSCGSSLDTQLFLYDAYLRDPELKKNRKSRENCSGEAQGHFSHVFESPGEYHVVVEPWHVIRYPDAGEIRLSMQCK